MFRPLRVLTAVFAVACVATVEPVTLQQGTDKLDPLVQLNVSLTSGASPVVVVGTPGTSLDALTLVIQQAGGTVVRQLAIVNGIAATIPNVSLTAVAASALVQHIAYDRRTAGGMERTGPTTGATFVRSELGVDGSGVGVAVIDSGVTSWHDDLTDPASGQQRVAQFVDLVGGAAAPYDDYGHGTHVAGIIAGNGHDSGGARAGIAPGAQLVVIKALDGSGQGRISDVIAGLDYVVAHQSDYNIRVVNLSIAAGVYESYTSDPLTQAAKRAVDSGIVVVAAAGNAGRNQNGTTQYGGVTAPGNAPWVLTVGASSTMGTIDRSDDTVAGFSSRGPTAVDRLAKPDLVAPGVGTESLSVPGSTLAQRYSAYLLNGTVATDFPPYLSLSGTSMAAPVVAGTVALMLQANPTLTPNAIKAILQYTAQPYAGYDTLTQGTGFLNARGAVELSAYFASPSTTAYPSTDGWGRQILWGNYLIGGGVLTSGSSALASNIVWGSMPSGTTPISFGTICTGNCGTSLATFASWSERCGDLSCGSVTWNGSAADVVWGYSCSNTTCSTSPPSGAPGSGNGATVVWGSSDGDTVVWGSNDGDTVVWGSNCGDPGCDPVVWPPQPNQ